MERMSDERLAEVWQLYLDNEPFPDDGIGELLQALKAERAHVAELEAAMNEAHDDHLKQQRELFADLYEAEALLDEIENAIRFRSDALVPELTAILAKRERSK